MKFISDFMDNAVPKEIFWLTRYFKSDVGLAFVKYFACFRSAVHFSEHTGFQCNIRYLKRMKRLFVELEKKHDEARAKLDFETVAKLETGKFKLN